ncbi:MAG: carbohydrate ABC transporter permease [bacterium]|nr:carbohydrate ABC transporter permease [bacterium]
MGKKHTKIKRSFGDQVVQVIIYVVLTGFAISTVLPFLYIVAGSFATEKEIVERPFFIIPRVISFNAYKFIMETGETFRGLRNSIFVTLVGTAINMLFTTTFAYPLSKKDFKGRNIILNLVIVTMVFSGGMIPSFLVIKNMHLLNTYWALFLPGAISAFNLVIVKNFFEGIPKELEEAAIMDGCNDFWIFAKIILPLSKPVLASISLFYAVGHWNDYFAPMMYISNPKMEVIQIVLRRVVLLANGVATDGSMLDYGTLGAPPDKAVKMAVTVVATVPILLVYPFIQKYFTKGAMIGAVKG